MKVIRIGPEHQANIEKFARHFTLNGFSNLNREDLAKSSRYAYQLTGVQGECAFALYRHGSAEAMFEMMQRKVDLLIPLMKGDGGYDAELTHNGKTRIIDVKTSYADSPEKIRGLNLVVPERELHDNMIYVAAFSLGRTREAADRVVLAGWCITEDITHRWHVDPAKWAVGVKDLRPMSELEIYWQDQPRSKEATVESVV